MTVSGHSFPWDGGTAVYLFTGHYGSGKTETAVNFARFLRERYSRIDAGGEHKIALLDMDIVNPFFRSADAQELLEKADIRVEVPFYANTNVDMPSLPASMGALIRDRSYDVIADIGGDDMGARAVGCYSDDILSRRNFRFFVMNRRRPFTETAKAALKVYDEIDAVSKVPCAGIINNTNLLDETDASLIAEGYAEAAELGRLRGVPVVFSTAPEGVYEELILSGDPAFSADNVIPLRRTVRRLF
ncbi:MAG: hypothetical protein J5950_00880 [Clostridia bacterium]|nr:hypothetical protein [Clostridia bacterium]